MDELEKIDDAVSKLPGYQTENPSSTEFTLNNRKSLVEILGVTVPNFSTGSSRGFGGAIASAGTRAQQEAEMAYDEQLMKEKNNV